jgi:endogenous inhibitor of DNA gyrase (YacG/DUF329 family)
MRELVRRCPSCGDWIPIDKIAPHIKSCSERKWNSLIDYLSENGPTSNAILNNHGLTVAGNTEINSFSPHGLKAAGNASRVIYLQSHSPELVIRTWIVTNEDDIRGVSRSSITRRISESHESRWVNEWRQLADEFGFASHQEAPDGASNDPIKKCPKCGQGVQARKYVNHIQHCG